MSEKPSYTQVVILPSGATTLIEVHRSKRARVWRYATHKLTSKQVMRLYRVFSLSVWEQSVEFAYDMSPVVTLDSNKAVVGRKNARLVEIMHMKLDDE